MALTSYFSQDLLRNKSRLFRLMITFAVSYPLSDEVNLRRQNTDTNAAEGNFVSSYLCRVDSDECGTIVRLLTLNMGDDTINRTSIRPDFLSS